MGIISVDPDLAEDILQKISNLLRYTLNSADKDYVTIEEEVAITTQFLDIEKIRLGDRLNYSIDVDEDLNHCKIAPLILQPIVENSIKHGISKSRIGGTVEVKIGRLGDKLNLSIKDSLESSISKVDKNKGFGLQYLEKKLRLIYGEKYLLEIRDESGFKVEIFIPVS